MKKIILFALLSLTFFGMNAQESEETDQNPQKQNEFKINMTNLIAFKWVDLTYERILNEESSIGAGLLFAIDNEGDIGLDEYRTFSFTPYYRHFFSNKYAKGFFVEAFGMIHSGEEEIYNFTDDGIFDNDFSRSKFTDFAVGVSVGGKFVTKRGFIAEVYLGIGRDLLGNSDIEVVGRGGISLGYRF